MSDLMSVSFPEPSNEKRKCRCGQLVIVVDGREFDEHMVPHVDRCPRLASSRRRRHPARHAARRRTS